LERKIVIKKCFTAMHQWLTPVILPPQEAEIRRTAVRSQPGQIVQENSISKNLSQKRAGGMAQGVGPEFKPQYHQKKKKKKSRERNVLI
jgi:hypothetical protein